MRTASIAAPPALMEPADSRPNINQRARSARPRARLRRSGFAVLHVWGLFVRGCVISRNADADCSPSSEAPTVRRESLGRIGCRRRRGPDRRADRAECPSDRGAGRMCRRPGLERPLGHGPRHLVQPDGGTVDLEQRPSPPRHAHVADPRANVGRPGVARASRDLRSARRGRLGARAAHRRRGIHSRVRGVRCGRARAWRLRAGGGAGRSGRVRRRAARTPSSARRRSPMSCSR